MTNIKFHDVSGPKKLESSILRLFVTMGTPNQCA